MRQFLREVFGNPKDIMELVGIADADLLSGTWKLGVNDPRIEIDEIRHWFIQEQQDRQNPEDLIENAARLCEKAIGAAVIEDLNSMGDTIRYIFGMIEKHNKASRHSINPPPYFIAIYQLLILASSPNQRQAVLDGVNEAIGLDKEIFK